MNCESFNLNKLCCINIIENSTLIIYLNIQAQNDRGAAQVQLSQHADSNSWRGRLQHVKLIHAIMISNIQVFVLGFKVLFEWKKV